MYIPETYLNHNLKEIWSVFEAINKIIGSIFIPEYF